MANLPYDDTNPYSILEYGKRLPGMNFEDIYYEMKDFPLVKGEWDIDKLRNSRKRKGGLGNFIENYWFCYESNSKSAPDFEKAGVELKVTCYETKKKGNVSAGERLVLGMIPHDEALASELEESHIWKKSKLMLLVEYHRNKNNQYQSENVIQYVDLFTPPEEDMVIIRRDYKIIADKVRSGMAHALSEKDTTYLSACTKGQTAKKSISSQYYPAPDGKYYDAKRRAFSFKTTYMTYVLNQYLLKGVNTYEHLFTQEEAENHSFEELTLERLQTYKGLNISSIMKMLNITDLKLSDKGFYSSLAFRMLGIKSNRAEEFAKAGIVVKTLRLEDLGKCDENTSLPTFKAKEIINEDWETSELCNYLSDTKFLYFIYLRDGEEYRLFQTKFWSVPEDDIDGSMREVWEDTVSKIQNNEVKFTIFPYGKTSKVSSNFTKQTDNKGIYVNVHTSQPAYKLHNGFEKGNLKAHGDELPNGEIMTKSSFWFDKHYLLKQLGVLDINEGNYKDYANFMRSTRRCPYCKETQLVYNEKTHMLFCEPCHAEIKLQEITNIWEKKMYIQAFQNRTHIKGRRV